MNRPVSPTLSATLTTIKTLINASMQIRPFGSTGLNVSALGFGTGSIGAVEMDESVASRLLNEALDLGITLIDTARGYGLAEERIGKQIAHRRSEYVLSTKVGYGVDGVPDWTYECVAAGVDLALRTMRTDVIDVVHLHSCPLDTLLHTGVIDGLDAAKQAGKVRVVAYSGENDALAWAVASGRFTSFETSVNPFDQASLAQSIPIAAKAGYGVIAKRAVGNAPWRFADCPQGDYCEVYWHRLHTLAYDRAGLDWDDFALRFSTFARGVSSAIIGTSSIENLRRNAAIVSRGALPDNMVNAVQSRYREIGQSWPGEI
jgi:aryl-alcohol dehydrogenase-like predicted oxidoreductase